MDAIIPVVVRVLSCVHPFSVGTRGNERHHNKCNYFIEKLIIEFCIYRVPWSIYFKISLLLLIYPYSFFSIITFPKVRRGFSPRTYKRNVLRIISLLLLLFKRIMLFLEYTRINQSHPSSVNYPTVM